MKTCRLCKQEHDTTNFHKSQSICKACSTIRRRDFYQKNRDSERKKIREWAERNRDRVRNNQLAKYGITSSDYSRMRESQGNCCAICHRDESDVPRSNYRGSAEHALHVDHCHITGSVRGLLCFNCNALLGKARDSIDILRAAIGYLETAQEREEKNKKND